MDDYYAKRDAERERDHQAWDATLMGVLIVLCLFGVALSFAHH
jgi:hypothetical protein